MDAEQAQTDWFDRMVAVLYATVVVLGIATVAIAVAMYFPGSSGVEVPLP